jgi:TRAP-type C4-dicarboxylate transport system permease small subunit
MTGSSQTSSGVRRLFYRSITALETFSSSVIFIMMLLTFADVIGRYVLNKPIFGASEMISALLALAIFSGLGVTNARDEHIMVELFIEPTRKLLSPFIYEIVVQAFSVSAMLLIAVVLFEHALESYTLNSLTVVLELPLYYVTGSIALLALISVISQMIGIYYKFHDLRNSDVKK